MNAMSRIPLRRITALAALVLSMLLLGAAPAFAHGGGGPDASNYRSVVLDVVDGAAAATPDAAPVDPGELTWRVLANDSLLEVRNNTDQELLVLGYQDEPYLRIGPEGVFENRNSPATYLSNDRFATTPVPETASPDAEPDWQQVSDQPVYAWHDHRIHWMAPTLPPQVKVDASQPVKVQDWSVPYRLGDQDFAVRGTLTWEPPPAWWPWIVAPAVAAAAGVLPAFARRDRDARRRFALQAGSLVLGVVVILNFVHGIDDIISVPATLAENLVASLQTFVPVLIAAWAAWRARTASPGAAQALLIGTAAVTIGLGLTHTTVLASSQVASRLPEWFSRLVVGMDFGIIVSTALAVLGSGEMIREEPAGQAVVAEGRA